MPEISHYYDQEIADALNPANAGKADEPDPADKSVANPAVIRALAQAIREKYGPNADTNRIVDELRAAVYDAHNHQATDRTYDADDPVDSVSDNLTDKLAQVRQEEREALDAAVSFKITGKDDKGDYVVEFQDKDTGHMATVVLNRSPAGDIKMVGDPRDISEKGAKEVPEYISYHPDKLLDATREFDKRAKEEGHFLSSATNPAESKNAREIAAAADAHNGTPQSGKMSVIEKAENTPLAGYKKAAEAMAKFDKDMQAAHPSFALTNAEKFTEEQRKEYDRRIHALADARHALADDMAKHGRMDQAQIHSAIQKIDMEAGLDAPDDRADAGVGNPAVLRALAREIRIRLSHDPALANDPDALAQRANDELTTANWDAHQAHARDAKDSVSDIERRKLAELRRENELRDTDGKAVPAPQLPGTPQGFLKDFGKDGTGSLGFTGPGKDNSPQQPQQAQGGFLGLPPHEQAKQARQNAPAASADPNRLTGLPAHGGLTPPSGPSSQSPTVRRER